GLPGHRGAELEPETSLRLVLGAELRHVRPEQFATEQEQCGGQYRQREEHGDEDAGGAGETEGLVAGELREEEGEQAEHYRATARDDGGSRSPEGSVHRLATVFVQPQFVAVPGDQQQR